MKVQVGETEVLSESEHQQNSLKYSHWLSSAVLNEQMSDYRILATNLNISLTSTRQEKEKI